MNVLWWNERTRKTSDAEGDICFSCAIRERAACIAGGKARQRGLVMEWAQVSQHVHMIAERWIGAGTLEKKMEKNIW